MLKELFERILKAGVDSAEIKTADINGVIYSNKDLVRVRKMDQFKPDHIVFSSLSALCEYALDEHFKPGEPFFIHVADFDSVRILGQLQPENENKRWTYAVAVSSSAGAMEFGRWYELEKFVIALQAGFVETESIKTMLDWLGHLANETVINSNDDQFSQSIQIKTGITSKSRVKIENPIELQPFRTFREVDQPASTFILRLKNKDNNLFCALFEADGAAWKIEAMARVATFLKDKLPDISVLA